MRATSEPAACSVMNIAPWYSVSKSRDTSIGRNRATSSGAPNLRNVRVSEAPSFGKPVLIYDLRSPGAQAYIHLAGEVLKRERSLPA